MLDFLCDGVEIFIFRTLSDSVLYRELVLSVRFFNNLQLLLVSLQDSYSAVILLQQLLDIEFVLLFILFFLGKFPLSLLSLLDCSSVFGLFFTALVHHHHFFQHWCEIWLELLKSLLVIDFDLLLFSHAPV